MRFLSFYLLFTFIFGSLFSIKTDWGKINFDPSRVINSHSNLNTNSNIFTKIPRKIWQTYKTSKLPKQAKAAQKTWLSAPQFDYLFFNDNDIESYILENWDSNTYDFFKVLPLGVMKADLWRYLIICTEGGVYSDIDSILCKNPNSWNLPGIHDKEHILVIGLENDCHFCQWTFAATKEHPALQYVCEFLLNNYQKNGINLKNPHFVHATTGPGIWTGALRAYMGIEQSVSSGEIFKWYQQDKKFRDYLNSIGIWLLPKENFQGLWTKNLYGSQNFKDGYIKWTKEADSLSKGKR